MAHIDYTKKRTFLVNQATVGGQTNYLLRGNVPILQDGKTFAYDKMNNRFKELIGDSFDLKNCNLINISVITNFPTAAIPDEGAFLMAEFLAFGISNAEYNSWFPQSIWPPYLKKCPHFNVPLGSTINGNSGSMIWYPIQGCDASGPGSCSTIEPMQFNIDGLVQQLNNLLNTKNSNGKPNVIYYHCVNGHDRTSAITACYMMRYMGPKYTLEYVTTTSVPEGAMLENNHGIQWKEPYSNLITYYSNNYLPQTS